MSAALSGTARTPQVQSEIESLSKTGEMLRQAIGTLTERLKPILSAPRGASEASQKSVPQPTLAPMGETLSEIRRLVEAAVQSLNELRDRVEV